MIVVLFENEAIVFNDHERAVAYAEMLGKGARIIENVTDKTQ